MKKFLVLLILLLPLSVSAQTEPVYSEATNLKVEASVDEKNPGKINVNGTFTMTNRSSIPTAEIYYAVYGGLRGNSYILKYPNFGTERIGPIVLGPGETRNFEFSFQTKNMLQYGKMAAEVKVENRNGTSIDKTTEEIPLAPNRKFGKLAEPIIPGAQFEINGKNFGILESPVIYKGEDEAILNIEIPPLGLATKVTPRLVIHKNTYFSQPVTEVSFPPIISSTKDSVTTKIKVPENLDPGVYPFRIELDTSSSGQFIATLYGRYATGGLILQISDVTIPNTEKIQNVLVDLSSIVSDIVKPERKVAQDINVSVRVYGSGNNLLAEGVSAGESIDTFLRTDVELDKSVRRDKIERIEVEATTAGRILDSLTRHYSVPENTSVDFKAIIYTIISLVVLGLIVFFVNKKRNALAGISIVLLGMVIASGVVAQTIINSESVHFQYNASNYSIGSDTDAVSWPSFRTDNAVNINLNSPDQNTCYAPGTIVPFSFDITYELLDQVAPSSFIGTETVPTSPETFDVRVSGDDYWWVDTQDLSQFNFTQAAILLSQAESGNTDSANNPPSLNTDYQPSHSYHLTGSNNANFSLANASETATDGSGNIETSIVMPEEPGTHRIFVEIGGTHRRGESRYVGAIDVEVCQNTFHDACAFMPGKQYIDGFGDLRDEDGSLLDYTVQIFDDLSVDALGGDGVAEGENAFVSVCNYCPAFEDPSAGADPWWDKMKNLWVPFDANIPGATSNQIAIYFDNANNLSGQRGEKDIHTRVTGFWWGPDATWEWNYARNELGTYQQITESDEYQDDLIVHESGGNLFFLDVGSAKRGLNHNGNYAHNYNVNSYTLQDMMNAIWSNPTNNFTGWLDEKFFDYDNGNDVGLLDGNHTDTFIFRETEFDDFGEGPSHCVLYEDICPSQSGIQFTRYKDNSPSTSYVEIYTRVPGGPHTYHGQEPDTTATAASLCALLPPPSSNACPGIPGWTYDNVTNEVFDGSLALVPHYTYTSDGQCRAICSNVSSWTFEESSRNVYNSTNTLETTYLGLPTTIGATGGLCVNQCPNFVGTKSYNEIDNSVYDDLSETSDSTLSYDLGTNSCVSTDICSQPGTQWPVAGSSNPAEATDGTTTYSIASDGTCYVPLGSLSCTPDNDPVELVSGTVNVTFTALPAGGAGVEYYWPTGWSSNNTHIETYTTSDDPNTPVNEGLKEIFIRKREAGIENDHAMCQVQVDPENTFNGFCDPAPDKIMSTNETFNFEATYIDETGPVSFQWYDSGAPIVGETSSTYGPISYAGEAIHNNISVDITDDNTGKTINPTCFVTVDNSPPVNITKFELIPPVVATPDQCFLYMEAENVLSCDSIDGNDITSLISGGALNINGGIGLDTGTYSVTCYGTDGTSNDTVGPVRCTGNIEFIEQ